jgi:hypothetical protein
MLSAVVVSGCSPAAKPASPDPAAVVTALYRDHFAHEQKWGETYQRRRALFTRELATLLDADDSAAAANPDEIVGLDFDPLTDAQDTMTGFAVGPSAREGADALVPVTLRMDSARSVVRVRLTQAGNVWRVANLHYPHGDLASLLRQLAADRRK